MLLFQLMKYMFYANRRSTKVVSPAGKYTTLDKLRFQSYIGKKTSLIKLSLTLSNSFIHIAVPLSSKRKLVYLTKLEVMKIRAKLVEEVKVTLRLDQTDAAIKIGI